MKKLFLLGLFVFGFILVGLQVQADDGCSVGKVYSSTTGMNCGCSNGEVYSSTTGKICPIVEDICKSISQPVSGFCDDGTIQAVQDSNQCIISYKCLPADDGCFAGKIYSSTTGKICPIIITPNNPVISGVSGPQTLNVGRQGTWKVTASASNGANLSYSVVWGDEAYRLYSTSVGSSFLVPQQSTTFTHTYNQTGTYTPTFTVTSENTIRCFTTPCPGNEGSATASISVKVENLTLNCPIELVDCAPGFTGESYVGENGCVKAKCVPIPTPICPAGCSCYGDTVTCPVDNGCSAGKVYSSTTGQRCGCSNGEIYSSTTGQRCPTKPIVDNGCLPGFRYSSTTGQLCTNVTPEITCSSNALTETLRYGSGGYQVVVLQTILNTLNYLNIDLSTAEGIFGPKTVTAVKAFQVANGLSGDAVVGPRTRLLLNTIWENQCLGLVN